MGLNRFGHIQIVYSYHSAKLQKNIEVDKDLCQRAYNKIRD